MASRTPLALSLLALLAAGCDLASAEVGDGFRGGDDDPSSEDQDDDQGDDGDVPPADEPADEPPPADEPADEPPPADEPADDEPADEPPPADEPEDEPADALGSLDAAFSDCAFNMVWTKGEGYNSGLPIDATQLAAQDADTLEFQPDHRLAYIFPNMSLGGQDSVLTLELLEVDADTGEYIIGATVENSLERLTLPPLSLDITQPVVISDSSAPDPEAFGQATLITLADGTSTNFELRWGLVVDLNGGANVACQPLLEAVYGPF